jgi:SAM-dependent methyltransferase
MSGDEATLDFYTREAAAYADYTSQEKRSPLLVRFAEFLPAGGDVLDFGCGSGWGANRFNEMGFRAVGFDGSEGLAAEARERYGVDVTVGRFDSFDAEAAYDGIWASFCLLHDTRAAMPGHLVRLHRALRPGGALYVGLKQGEGESRDSLGRLYTYFGADEMTGYLTDAGFGRIEIETDQTTGYDGADVISMHIFAHRD